MNWSSALDVDILLSADVVIPARLNSALVQGRLVVFVGAGASISSPSDLPSFGKLTDEVFRLADKEPPSSSGRQDDVELGKLHGDVFDVKNAVRTVLSPPGSLPNDWHKAIIGLWRSETMPIRVVTTNYDAHLESVASEADVYVSPALPLGATFEGIVHLHGVLDGKDEGLVVTDGDFGRAYLTEGWARRFLVDVFTSDLLVLFVGYSHDDTVMRYLARGLPPGSDTRFALVRHTEDMEKWRGLGIEPIAWTEHPGDPYGPGVLALDEWGRRVSLRPSDVASEVQLMAKGPPLLTPLEEDFLSWAILDRVGAKAFREHASGTEWLEWASRQRAFLAS